MTDPIAIALVGASVLLTIALASMACSRGGMPGSITKRLELASQSGEAIQPRTGGRIEIADLKERVRKLEAIAAGIDL
jgi:hypothetical protein